MASLRLARASRRTFLRLGAAGIIFGSLLMQQPLPTFAQSKPAASPLKIGIVGSGKLGGTVGSLWVKAGHEVMFSSRHPEELKDMASKLGPRARVGTVQEAIAFGDVILLAVPYSALPQIGRENGSALKGKIIVDASNPVVRRDGQVAEEAMTNGIGATSLKYLPGTRYVRAFNPVGTAALENESHRAGTPIGMPVAGDDAQAVKVATQLVRDAGFEPVVVPLARASEFAPGTPIFGKPTPVDELRKYLGVAR
ncbi:MAG: NADPH-dependent F420 reductase [Burkholderiales bacterium]